jgi:hypothetical protein
MQLGGVISALLLDPCQEQQQHEQLRHPAHLQ